tara:strand:- start:723 stop:1673 length:951 start_codon:yes stop_codon:yes gene_type:complete
MRTWLIGSGGMARDYLKALSELNVAVTVIGRGETSAISFEETTGFPVERGGLEAYLQDGKYTLPDNAIVAVGVERLAPTVTALLKSGVKRILVEKPGGLYGHDILELSSFAASYSSEVYVAYNRRFYSSVRKAKEMILDDGGVQSFSFEFTEWGHEIENLTKAPGVKEQWVLGNSSHVIDLAFYLGGTPKELFALHAGSLSWHPNAAIFSGAGSTIGGALFSYQANWDAPGRWGIEVCTRNYRFILRPMETLQIIRKGSVTIEQCTLEEEELDKKFKPGLFLQTKAFLHSADLTSLCNITEHSMMLPNYLKIAGYK